MLSAKSHPFLFQVLLLLMLAFLLSACSSDQPDRSKISAKATLTDFTGSWATPEAYRENERAEMTIRISGEEEDELSGSFLYSRSENYDHSTADRFFFEGGTVGTATEVGIRNSDGDQVGKARLTLRNGELHVQMLRHTDQLPGIFILEREDEEQ